MLNAFRKKESWACIVYAQSSNAVGGRGSTGAATGGRKTEGDKKRENLKSLARDFKILRRQDYLSRMVSIMLKKHF